MHEAGLHVHAKHHAEPDQVNTHLGCHRGQERDDDEGYLEEIKKKRQEEHEDVHGDQKADLTAGQARQHVLDPDATVHTLEHKREHA